MSADRIELITATQAYPLRNRVLRPDQPIEASHFKHDFEPTTFHFGYFHASELVSVGSFVLESHPKLEGKLSYRLRGMATDEKYRGRGFGAELLRRGLDELQRRHCDLLWFNAREKAFRFYESMGFQYEGDLFIMELIGPHKVMYKHLI